MTNTEGTLTKRKLELNRKMGRNMDRKKTGTKQENGKEHGQKGNRN